MKNKLYIWIWVLCMVAAVSSGCRKLVGPTKVTVVDNDRHYVPILQGEILRMYWTLRNDGEEPFVIEDVQPACSAIKLVSDPPAVVVQGDSAVMIFDFDTEKNVNMTSHIIRIYGNAIPDGKVELLFDVNVVRGTLGKTDYEERFFSRYEGDGSQQGKKIRRNAYDIIPMETNTYEIHFAPNKNEILPESMVEIERIAVLMQDNPHLSFEVQGHTDSVGTDVQNNRLSQARAEAVVAALVKKGVSENRLTAVGKGAHYPIADNNTEEGRAKNRRVVFKKK